MSVLLLLAMNLIVVVGLMDCTWIFWTYALTSMPLGGGEGGRRGREEERGGREEEREGGVDIDGQRRREDRKEVKGESKVEIDRQIGRQRDRQAGRETDRQAKRQTGTQAERQKKITIS